MRSFVVFALALCAVPACGGDKPSGGPGAGLSATPAPGFGDGPVADRVMMKLVDDVATCDIDHRGLLVDFGTEMMRGRAAVRGSDAGAPMKVVEHHGSTWSIADRRSIEVTFTLPEPARIFIGARLQPEGAKSVTFVVDDQTIGSARFKGPNDPRIVETEATSLPFDAGEHTLLIKLSPAKVRGAYAHIDWVRIGFPDEMRMTYGPPTLPDIVQMDAALSKVPHRALRLKTPTTLRCPVRVPAGARLRMALGVIGAKDGTAEIAVRVDGKPPVLLLQKTLKGGDDATWEDVDVSLDPYAGQLVHLELRTAGAPSSGRVLFGDPEIVVPSAEPESTRKARVAVVVVLSGVERSDLPGYAEGNTQHLERLTKFAERATLFTHHRASTNVVPGNLATLLTGLPPEVHTIVDHGSALPPTVPTLAQRARDAAVQTALFTEVPHTFGPAGMSRGLTKFVEISPVEGEERDALSEAAKWLGEAVKTANGGKVLLVVHARGGHPPWHASQKQVDALPPANYSGDIQPRRAAQQLAMLRRKSARADLSDNDMVRIGGYYQLALQEQDRAFGLVLDALDAADLENDAFIAVTSDLSSGLSTLFAEAPAYDEKTLELPLYVLFPKGQHGGRRVESPTGVEDLAITLTATLGLDLPKKPWGRDLAHVASGFPLQSTGPRFAIFGDAYAVRDGWLLLRDRRNARATLCDLELDPTCSFDRRPLHPLGASALARALAVYEQRVEEEKVDRVALVLDDDTLAALKVWGAME